MLKIDSHHHFWRFNPETYDWINKEMSVIQRDFLAQDLYPILQENQLDGCVTVQSEQNEEHNAFLLEHAAANPFIKGVVGWIDLRAENVEESLAFYKSYNTMKGFRHVLQGEEDRALMLKPEFKRGIKALGKAGYTYDILIFPDQLVYTKEFAKEFQDQKLVIDHIAKPYIKDKKIDQWKKDIQAVAEHENVYCKVSGMVTEADWKNWKTEDFTPYLDVVFEAFGVNRLMFGSDWPVCNVAGGYTKMIDIVKQYTAKLSEGEKELFWGGNAIQFYNL